MLSNNHIIDKEHTSVHYTFSLEFKYIIEENPHQILFFVQVGARSVAALTQEEITRHPAILHYLKLQFQRFFSGGGYILEVLERF